MLRVASGDRDGTADKMSKLCRLVGRVFDDNDPRKPELHGAPVKIPKKCKPCPGSRITATLPTPIRLILVVAALLALLAFLPWAILCMCNVHWGVFNVPITGPNRVLLVTAHPDDEVVFFSPTLSGLDNEEVFILCFTSG